MVWTEGERPRGVGSAVEAVAYAARVCFGLGKWTAEPGLPSHPAWYPNWAWIAATGGADRRSAKNAAGLKHQSCEAHHMARPRSTPRGAYSPGRSEPRATVHEVDQAIPLSPP